MATALMVSAPMITASMTTTIAATAIVYIPMDYYNCEKNDNNKSELQKDGRLPWHCSKCDDKIFCLK